MNINFEYASFIDKESACLIEILTKISREEPQTPRLHDISAAVTSLFFERIQKTSKISYI